MSVELTPEVYWSCVEGIDYSGLPEPDRQSIRNYIERGMSPGSGLQLILENNLKAIFFYRNPDALCRVASWVHNSLPLPVWGSRKRVRAWMKLASSVHRSPRCTAEGCKFAFNALAP